MVLKPKKAKTVLDSGKNGEQWKGRRKYKMEHQVKEVKISTTLYSINHCQKWKLSKTTVTFFGLFYLFIYLFVSRHEVHSTNTHTLQNAGWYKQTKQNGVHDIESGGITGLQTLFATAFKTEP